MTTVCITNSSTTDEPKSTIIVINIADNTATAMLHKSLDSRTVASNFSGFLSNLMTDCDFASSSLLLFISSRLAGESEKKAVSAAELNADTTRSPTITAKTPKA